MGRVIPEWIRRARKGTTGKRAGFKHGFRSGLEEKIGAFLEQAGVPVLFEKRRLAYLLPATKHHYTYDFELPNGIICEGKGIFDAADRTKHVAIKAQYGDALDIRFVFYGDPYKTKAHGTTRTLAEWCTKYGFKFAHKLPPKEWLAEPGPKDKPEVVLARGPFAWLKDVPKGYELP